MGSDVAGEDPLRAMLGDELAGKVVSSKILVVGAGGIGCELLKSLVMTGFSNIDVIDLDTIDVTNLNRQFLFQKQHVGKSKAMVACESAKRFNPKATVVAHHGDVKTDEFGADFFKQFDVCLNALDNLGARNHVNRMCLAAGIPLIESGTAGYLGQVSVIRKGETECFECHPKPPPKSFPVCTIRNTPSLPIHCIVWAKFVFHQLFGHADDENTISPNMEDPEHMEGAGVDDGDKQQERKETALRHWASSMAYDPRALFDRIFLKDIEVLLSMAKLWEKRRPPVPLHYDDLPSDEASQPKSSATALATQRLWSLQECADLFIASVRALQSRRNATGNADVELDWDKDDQEAMDFVAATANLRAYAFGIPMKSLFDIKSMAGNIIPAIATTNAVIGGLIVTEALNILAGRFDKCKMTYLWRHPNARKRLLVPTNLQPPNPNCYVCAERPEVSLLINVDTATLGMLQDRVLRAKLGMVQPDVMWNGKVLISSEEEDNTPEQMSKVLRDMGVGDEALLEADDFLQKFTLRIRLRHTTNLPEDQDFDVVGSAEPLPEPSPAVRARVATPVGTVDLEADAQGGADSRKRPAADADADGADGSAKKRHHPHDDDDIIML